MGDKHGRADVHCHQHCHQEPDQFRGRADTRDLLGAQSGNHQRVNRDDRRVKQLLSHDRQGEPENASLVHRAYRRDKLLGCSMLRFGITAALYRLQSLFGLNSIHDHMG